MWSNFVKTEGCSECQSPSRQLWPPLPKAELPRFVKVNNGNYISLFKREKCNALWCSSDFEPYLGFTYSVKWDLSDKDFKIIHEVDDGETLRNWLASKIKILWKSLSAEDAGSVEKHRERTSYSMNPVDGIYKGKMPDLKSFL
jgi:hypothetical protein